MAEQPFDQFKPLVVILRKQFWHPVSSLQDGLTELYPLQDDLAKLFWIFFNGCVSVGMKLLLDDLMPARLLMPSRVNEAFGQAVRTELDSRGLSLRQVRIRTGIDIDTISRMRQGEVPRMDKIVDFARGFEQDPNDWLELAGYERIERPPPLLIAYGNDPRHPHGTPPDDSGYPQAYARLMREAEERLAADGVLDLPESVSALGGTRGLTPEDAARDVAAFEDAIRRRFGASGG